MRLTLLGASGRTGEQVIAQARARGHEVTAVARHLDAIDRDAPHVTALAADATDARELQAAVAGADAVVSALGVGASRAPTELYSRAAANLAAALPAGTRVAVVSAAPAGPRAEQRPLERRVLMPILDRVYGATYADMRRMEAILAGSALDWVALRPPRLVARAGAGGYRCGGEPLPGARSLSFSALATALLDAVDGELAATGGAYVTAPTAGG